MDRPAVDPAFINNRSLRPRRLDDPATLAHRAACPLARLDGLVAKLQRVLNVDGYEVLRLDRRSDLVELNVDLLRRQFELE
jgi:hypothetical protein